MMSKAIIQISCLTYRLLLQLYPDAFREQFGAEMRTCFRNMMDVAIEERGLLVGSIVHWWHVACDLIPSIVEQYCQAISCWRSNWRQTAQRQTRNVVFSIFVACLVALVFRASVAQAFEARTHSVGPDLKPGDRALVYRWASDFEPGEIVVFKNEHGKFRFGRVGSDETSEADKVPITRFEKPAQFIDRSKIVGKVIFSYRIHKSQPGREDEAPQGDST